MAFFRVSSIRVSRTGEGNVAIYFGQPPVGFCFWKLLRMLSIQLPSSFNTSGLGPRFLAAVGGFLGLAGLRGMKRDCTAMSLLRQFDEMTARVYASRLVSRQAQHATG